MELYRALAEQAPDAFTPALAGSLNTLSNAWSAVGDHQKAPATIREAAEFLIGFVQESPPVHAELTQLVYANYLNSCQQNNVEPDATLLAALKEALQYSD